MIGSSTYDSSKTISPEECLDLLSRSPILKRNDLLTRPSTKMLKGRVNSESTLECINNLLAEFKSRENFSSPLPVPSSQPSAPSSQPSARLEQCSHSSLDDVFVSATHLVKVCQSCVHDELLSDSCMELKSTELVNKVLAGLSPDESRRIEELLANSMVLKDIKS